MNDKQRLRLEYLYHIARANDLPLFFGCEDCRETDLRKLTGGHRDNDGATHREALLPDVLREARSGHFPRRLRELGWPAEDMRKLRIECYSCNNAKRSVLRSLDNREMKEYLRGLDKRQEARAVAAIRQAGDVGGPARSGEDPGRRESAAGGPVRDGDADPAAGHGGVL